MCAYLSGRIGPLFIALCSLLCSGCRREHGEPGEGAANTQADAPSSSFREDEPGVLFVWVGENGEFHTSTKSSDVPPASRQVVRVLFEKRGSGSADQVLVTNLTEREPDGSHRLSNLARAEWESRGLSQRKARVPAPPSAEKPSDDPAATLDVDATIYGASWCKPCHLAEDYLKKRGARVVKKDIEEDPKAAAEMHQVLRGAGLSGASIPVLNVGGTVLVGFSTSAIDSALRRATKTR